MSYGRQQKVRGGKRHLKHLVRQSLTAAPLSGQLLQQDTFNFPEA